MERKVTADFKTRELFEDPDLYKRLKGCDSVVRSVMSHCQNDRRERFQHTTDILGKKIFRCDLHSHSTYSDGKSDLNELAEWVEKEGLDLLAITDHWSVEQAPECKEYEKLYFGIEISNSLKPRHHVVGISVEDPIADTADTIDSVENMFRAIEAKGGIPILAHPAGWYKNPYDRGLIAEAEQFDNQQFIMEVGNGAVNSLDYFDEQDHQALLLWDRLLGQKKNVKAVGNSDAHHYWQVGTVWNGVAVESADAQELLRLISAGRSFFSNGPICDLHVNDHSMGETLAVPRGTRVTIKADFYDSAGLAWVRLIRDARCVKQIFFESTVESYILETDEVVDNAFCYFRAECLTIDSHRAYSNAIRICAQ